MCVYSIKDDLIISQEENIMSRKIEQLLRIAGDLHRFSENSSAASGQVPGELFEDELELISAAVYEPAAGMNLGISTSDPHTGEQ